MKNQRHGLSIGIEQTGDKVFLVLKATGKLTHDDYKLINPLIDSALDAVQDPLVNVLFDGTDLEGWELRAAWDDFRLGLKHGNQFNKIAIYGNKRWQQMAAKIGSWFISGEAKFFTDIDEALEWLHA
jgi:SpoIIAA-like